MFKAALIFLVFGASIAAAYPTTLSEGYVSCRACHTAFSGGTQLTAYGRIVASQLSSVSRNLPSMEVGEFVFGFEARAVQLQVETPVARIRKFLIMQDDVQAAYTHNGIHVEGDFSVHNKRPRNFWAQYSTDSFWLRAGKFIQQGNVRYENHLFEPSKTVWGEIGGEFGYYWNGVAFSVLGNERGVMGTAELLIHRSHLRFFFGNFDYGFDFRTSPWPGSYLALSWHPGGYVATASLSLVRGVFASLVRADRSNGVSGKVLLLKGLDFEVGILGNRKYIVGHISL